MFALSHRMEVSTSLPLRLVARARMSEYLLSIKEPLLPVMRQSLCSCLCANFSSFLTPSAVTYSSRPAIAPAFIRLEGKRRPQDRVNAFPSSYKIALSPGVKFSARPAGASD